MAVDYKDYYKVLGVSKDADQQAIRQAYRKLARQYHPDVNPHDKAAEEKFKEINEANEVLSDPEKRKKYDEMSANYQRYGYWSGATANNAAPRADAYRGGSYQYQTISEEDLEDLFGGRSPFSDFFETYFHSGFAPHDQRTSAQRARRARPRTTPGEDVETQLDVSLADAYRGATRVLELSEPDGRTRRLEVKIPAGVDDGARIRIAKQGIAGTDGQRGDLYLLLHILPDPRFTREGTTVRTTVDVPLVTAMTGGEIQVTTPDQRQLMLRIPAGTENGKAIRLRGQGMPQRGKPDQRGDLFAVVNVVLPGPLNDEQRRLFAAFARSLSGAKEATASETGGSSYV
ncbi:MAG TPA: J domain-containing protein [Dictyobacter sp.]|jgi:curved DNA-binding protein|nr:J domain-containing protein [Dictyobacter sp.]